MQRLAVLLAVGGCSKPAVSGSAMPLNLTPTPPSFATSLDFDLLATLRGEKCVDREVMKSQVYWTATYNTDKISDDKLTRAAIAGAAYEAVRILAGVDAFIVTRVIATARGADTVCAQVYGRALRLKKYEPRSPEPESTQPLNPETGTTK